MINNSNNYKMTFSEVQSMMAKVGRRSYVAKTLLESDRSVLLSVQLLDETQT